MAKKHKKGERDPHWVLGWNWGRSGEVQGGAERMQGFFGGLGLIAAGCGEGCGVAQREAGVGIGYWAARG